MYTISKYKQWIVHTSRIGVGFLIFDGNGIAKGELTMDISCILSRRSVRTYLDKPILQAQIQLLLKAGMYAPSAQNSQPWEFIVLRDRAKLDKLSEGAQYWKMLKQAPLAIVVLANPAGYKASNQGFFIQDCAACTQNILVAAEGMGLGGVWLGTYGVQDRMAFVAELLGIPEGIHPFSIISLGHPATPPVPHDFFLEEKVHYDSY